MTCTWPLLSTTPLQGIELLEAKGKNDGMVEGIRYFTCPENCGVFVSVRSGKATLIDQTDTLAGPRLIKTAWSATFGQPSTTPTSMSTAHDNSTSADVGVESVAADSNGSPGQAPATPRRIEVQGSRGNVHSPPAATGHDDDVGVDVDEDSDDDRLPDLGNVDLSALSDDDEGTVLGDDEVEEAINGTRISTFNALHRAARVGNKELAARIISKGEVCEGAWGGMYMWTRHLRIVSPTRMTNCNVHVNAHLPLNRLTLMQPTTMGARRSCTPSTTTAWLWPTSCCARAATLICTSPLPSPLPCTRLPTAATPS